MTTPKIKTVSIAGDRWYIDPLTGDKVPGVSSVKDTLAKPGLLYGAVKVAANYAVDNVDTIKALALTDRDAAVDLVKRKRIEPDFIRQDKRDIVCELAHVHTIYQGSLYQRLALLQIAGVLLEHSKCI